MAATDRQRRTRRRVRILRWLSLRLASFLRLSGWRRPARPSRRPAARTGASLRALTAAALVLPGIAPVAARAAEDDEVSFQYGHYQEGERHLYDVHSDAKPLQVDSLLVNGRFTLFDRFKLAVNYLQDSWSGATPITTAPLVMGGNRSHDGVSGATPFINGDLYLDRHGNPLEVNGFGEVTGTNTQNVHTLSSASQETRQQLDAQLGHEWDDLELHGGGGFSYENDYESWFAQLGGRWDFDQKRTSLSFGGSVTASDTTALLDHDAVPYIDTSAYRDQIHVDPQTGNRTLNGQRRDWSAQLGLTRILGPNTRLDAGAAFVRSRGYLENPYKVVEVAFIDPAQQIVAPPGTSFAQVRALLEQRPNVRNQWTFDVRLAQYLERFDAALHFGYRYYHDDWGIDANTLEASWSQPLGHGWLITPRIRYYSQSAADFYVDYLVSNQAYQTVVSDPDTGDIISLTPFNPRLLPRSFSSDQRLSGFGALSGGLTLSKQLANGIRLESSFEYYTHEGKLKLGGGGEGSFADYDYWVIGLGLRLDANALHAFQPSGAPGDEHEGHAGHGLTRPPAGVMLGHMLGAGDTMVGFQYMFERRSGDVLHGASSASDAQIAASGCEGDPCRSAPQRMDMNMYMLDLMWAPIDWLNLMLMPSMVDMQMDLRALAGSEVDPHTSHEHSTGGLGDTRAFALLRLFDSEGQHAHLGLGLSVPIGDVNVQFAPSHGEAGGFEHYDMQLGSGTWDFLPSLTYTGRLERLAWGAQASGVVRLQHVNRSGYGLGDVVQLTAWSSYDLQRWLSASLRGVYTRQGRIAGEFDGTHGTTDPVDFPSNSGGEYWDVGVGLGATVPSGYLAGNRLSVEWLQPVAQQVKGYQLERRGSLFVLWSVDF